MNTNRRDILKFFAAGTIITPVSGGATAKLIEPPKADIVKPPSIVAPFYVADIESVEITFTMKDGSHRTMDKDMCPIQFRSGMLSKKQRESVMGDAVRGEIILTELDWRTSPATSYPLLTARLLGFPK